MKTTGIKSIDNSKFNAFFAGRKLLQSGGEI